MSVFEVNINLPDKIKEIRKNNPISTNIEIVKSYCIGTLCSVSSNLQEDSDGERYACMDSAKLIVGYRFKNLDKKPLKYLKAHYNLNGTLDYREITVPPKSEFIITRHELGIFVIMCGNKLRNGSILGYTSVNKQSTYDKFYGSSMKLKKLPYIRLHKGESLRDEKYLIDITETSLQSDIHASNGCDFILKQEYRKDFYWVEYSRFFVGNNHIHGYKMQSNTLYVGINKERKCNSPIKLDIDLGRTLHRQDFLEIRGNVSEDEINTLYDAYKNKTLSDGYISKYITTELEEYRVYSSAFKYKGYTELSLNLSPKQYGSSIKSLEILKILSPNKIVIFARDMFRKAHFSCLDISGATLYNHNIGHVFYGSNIEKLYIDGIECDVDESIRNIFLGAHIGEIITNNNILIPISLMVSDNRPTNT